MNEMKVIGTGLALSLLASSWALAADNKVPASLDADTVEYDMRTGEIIATDNVLMKRGDAKVAGARATYNINTMAGSVIGNVIAVKGDIRITCDQLISEGQEHMLAMGSVHGTQ